MGCQWLVQTAAEWPQAAACMTDTATQQDVLGELCELRQYKVGSGRPAAPYSSLLQGFKGGG